MKDLRTTEVVQGVRTHRAPCRRRHRHYTTSLELATTLLPAYRQAAKVIESLQPVLLHTHFVLPSGLIAYALKRKFGIPYVLTAHGSDIPGYNPDRFETLHTLLRPVWQRIVAGAAGVTSPSEFLAGLIRRSADVPITVVPNGYAPPAPLGRTKRNLVLVVARLFPRKGVQHVIEALRGTKTAWEIVVAGDGPYKAELERHTQRAHVPVRFLGFVGPQTLRGLYEEARILVFPSLRENFPMVLLEAMDAGCAVISTDAEGCAEVVGDAGIIVEKGNPRDIRSALHALMSDSARIEELAQRGRERAQLFRWPRIAEQYLAVFNAALQRSTAGSATPGGTVPRSQARRGAPIVLRRP
jgi:glycosyltransferase involved in cell wall biosynthesis